MSFTQVLLLAPDKLNICFDRTRAWPPWPFYEYSLLMARPTTNRRISLVPAPISYNLASRMNLPVGYSLMYPLPPATAKRNGCISSGVDCGTNKNVSSYVVWCLILVPIPSAVHFTLSDTYTCSIKHLSFNGKQSH